MSNAVRVRVEVTYPLQATDKEREKTGQFIAKLFKRKCQDFDIMHIYKEHEFYTKPSEKRRKKKRQKQQQCRIRETENEWARNTQ